MSLSEGYISCLIWSLTLCCSHGQISLEYNTDSKSHALLLTSPSWYFNTGVIFGTSYFVAPSACNEIETSSEEMNQSELNNQCVRMISFIFVIFWFNCVYVKNFVNYPNSYGFWYFRFLSLKVFWFPGNIFVQLFANICCFHLSKSGYSLAVFQGVCGALHTMDRGLVCSSYYNVDTMRETAFHCYYILQPSDKGPMLLRVSATPFYWLIILK